MSMLSCPKCGHENPAERPDCLRCGVIFSKLRSQDIPPLILREQDLAAELPERGARLRDLFLPAPGEGNSLLFAGRAAIFLVMLVWGCRLVFAGIESNAAGESLLHLINLPFHEAGHVIFRPLGSFITSLGGTLGQLLIPLICLTVLLLQTRDPFGAAVCCWWFGENFLDIAPYINDARAGELPLLGGNFGHSSPYGFHDWEYLLTESGLLRYDHALAKAAHLFGSLLMAAALLWAGTLLYRQFRRQPDAL
jgi:hypothetical protein